MEKKELKGKIVVITGASAGLGRAMVREFASKGAIIALLARGKEGLDAAVADVERLGGYAKAYCTDVAVPEQIEAAASAIESQLGPIDIWINNAMVSVLGEFIQMEPGDFKRVTEVTYLGQVYGTQTALKCMIPRNHGTIILVGSALAYRGIPLQSAYCGAKHGIHGFFESVRTELLHNGSKVDLCMVQLPAMNTTQFGFVKSYLPNKPQPMGKIYEPEFAARVIAQVALNPRREVFVGFPTLEAIIGNKMAPALLDRYLAKTGYKGQQTNEVAGADRKDNLYAPLPGDHGVRGSFGKKASGFSTQFWLASNKRLIGGTMLFIGLGLGWLIARRAQE